LLSIIPFEIHSEGKCNAGFKLREEADLQKKRAFEGTVFATFSDITSIEML
jgi:hypothetical protein